MSQSLAVCTLSFLAGAACAADYPVKPVTLVVGFAPGGTTDVLARLAATQMAKSLKQPVVVENRAGAAGVIAADYVARAKPDGYTIMITTSSVQGTAPALYKNLPYDTATAFAPISMFSLSTMALVANNQLPASTLAEVVKLAKDKPDSLAYASAGPGSTAHIISELFSKAADIKMLHVPYQSGSAALPGVMAGDVQIMFDNIATNRELIVAGKVKPIAVTSKTRTKSLPDVPTLVEAGYKDLALYSWSGFVAPAGTPPAILVRLNQAVNDALASAEVRNAMEKGATEPTGSRTPEEFGDFIAQEQKTWGDAIRATGISLD